MRAAIAVAGAAVLCAFGCATRAASIGPVAVDLPLPSAAGGAQGGTRRAPDAPPPPLASREAPFPKVAQSRLVSGLEVAVAPAHALPIVQVRVVVRAGAGYGPVAGAAEMTADLLKDGGTRTKSSGEVLERIESLGASLSVDVDMDSSRLGLAVPKDELDAALALLAEIVTVPAFDERELGKLKGRKRDEARDNARSNGTWMATRALFHELFARDSPYSTFDLVPSEVAKVNALVVRDFHARYWVPKNAEVVVVGDVDAGSAARSVEKAFAGWKGGDPPKQAFPQATPPTRRRVVLVSRPKSAQSDVFVTNLVPPRKSAEWPAVRVATQVLGGGPSSRLFQDVREQRSLAYSAQARILELSHGEQPLVAYAGTQTPKTGRAVLGVLEDLERMTAAPPSEGEVEAARRYLSDVFAIRMETIGSIADLLATQNAFGLPDDYWDAYRAAVRATDVAQADAAATKLGKPSQTLIVVAGDADRVAPMLVHFGEVTILDPAQEFRATKTLPMNAEAPLDVGGN